jgi:glycosyltransferase involved in cell wall biosynthesis
MRIALIASPFISVPPARYGGTELFIAQLAEGLTKHGLDVVVYANGESHLSVEVRWLYEKNQWPIEGELYANLQDMNHSGWAIHDAWDDADIIHLNNVPGLPYSRFDGPEFVYTIHHPHSQTLSGFYEFYPQAHYVAISQFQRERENMPQIRTIHHGVDMEKYPLQEKKGDYLAFLGRIAPLKGTHVAIEIAQKAGVPLKIAGEVQPMYREYFESKIKPHLDGKFIEYVGEADLASKNELLGNARAMLFPIQWNEPFGLVMIESMAKGTPVLAFPGGAVGEVVNEGVSGHICNSVEDMVESIRELDGRFDPVAVRKYAAENFSVDRMVNEYADLYREIGLAKGRTVPRQFGKRPSSVEFLPAPALESALQATLDSDVMTLNDEPEEPQAIA